MRLDVEREGAWGPSEVNAGPFARPFENPAQEDRMLDLAPSAHRNDELFQLANCIRALTIDAVEAAGSGHPGAPLGLADAATVLCSKYLKFDAGDPEWFDRDRLILSNGHASMLLYAMLELVGTRGLSMKDMQSFRQ